MTSTYVPNPVIFKSPISAYIGKTTSAGSGPVYEPKKIIHNVMIGKKSSIRYHLIITKCIIIVSANEHFV